MTTDITELAQREKFEAWFKSSFHPDKTGPYIKDQLFFAWKAAGAELVEALEKAQRHANLTEAERQAYLGLISKRDERIAELESRTVKLPGWFVKDAIAVYDRDEIEEALAAAGIKWEAE